MSDKKIYTDLDLQNNAVKNGVFWGDGENLTGIKAANVDGLAPVAKSGNYNDLTNRPTLGNGTITLKQGGTTKGSFTTNQSGDTTIDLDAGGGTPANMVTTNTKQTISASKTFGGTLNVFDADLIVDGGGSAYFKSGVFERRTTAASAFMTVKSDNSGYIETYNFMAQTDGEDDTLTITFPHKSGRLMTEMSYCYAMRTNKTGATTANTWYSISFASQSSYCNFILITVRYSSYSTTIILPMKAFYSSSSPLNIYPSNSTAYYAQVYCTSSTLYFRSVSATMDWTIYYIA